MLPSHSLLIPLLLSTAPLQPLSGPVHDNDSSFTPILSMSSEGCEAYLVDEKDQALLAALSMVDERILELILEIPDFDAPPELVPLLLRLFGGPGALTVGVNSEAIPGMPLPIAGELRLTQDSPQEAAALTRDLAAFIEQMGAPLRQPAEGKAWQMPVPVPLWMGNAGRDNYLRLGFEGGVQAPSLEHLLPEGARSTFSGMVDFGELLFLLEEVAGADSDVRELSGMVSAFGLEDFEYQWSFGTDAERSYFVFEMPGWAESAEQQGLLSDAVLEPSTVATIPEDATWAVAMSFDLGGIFSAYRQMFSELGAGDIGALIEEHTGLDVEADLIAPFGGEAVFYASDSTGGGGVLSTVAVLELGDHRAFLNTWGRLERAAADLGQREMQGYLRFSRYEHGGLELRVLSFPGLPVPFELCMTIVGDYAVLGATPQAVQAAAHQITHAERSLLDNSSFQEQLGPDMSGVVSLSWCNTPRLMQDGYGTVSLLCSALSNAIRSPTDTSREPGALLPSFNDLRSGAKGMVTITRRVGADFRSETRADRSQLVNAVGVAGYLYNSPILPILGAGIVAGLAGSEAIGQLHGVGVGDGGGGGTAFAPIEAPPDYENIVSEDFVALYGALEFYAFNNGGNYPDSLEELLVPDAWGASYLDQKHLIDPWGDAYLYTPPTAQNPKPVIDLKE